MNFLQKIIVNFLVVNTLEFQPMLTTIFIKFKKTLIVVLEEGWKYSLVPNRNALAKIRQIENVTCEKFIS
jgi:hypothetical protein